MQCSTERDCRKIGAVASCISASVTEQAQRPSTLLFSLLVFEFIVFVGWDVGIMLGAGTCSVASCAIAAAHITWAS
jgi:hypothetical protein